MARNHVGDFGQRPYEQSGFGMHSIHKRTRLHAFAKAALPSASRLLMKGAARNMMRYLELGSCLVQGKGAGAGWGMSSEIAAAARFITTDEPVLLDVGANYGEWSMLMLRRFPRCERLLMVEPQTKCVEALSRLEFANKVVLPVGVSDRLGEAALFTATGSEGWPATSLYARRETFFSNVEQRQQTVRLTTLDNIVDENGVSRVDFMKMDIEGAELRALQGAESSLRRGIIRALSFEFGSGNINSRTFFRDFWDLLTSCGFSIFRILPSGEFVRIEEYYEDLEYFRSVSNYVARLSSPPPRERSGAGLSQR